MEGALGRTGIQRTSKSMWPFKNRQSKMTTNTIPTVLSLLVQFGKQRKNIGNAVYRVTDRTIYWTMTQVTVLFCYYSKYKPLQNLTNIILYNFPLATCSFSFTRSFVSST